MIEANSPMETVSSHLLEPNALRPGGSELSDIAPAPPIGMPGMGPGSLAANTLTSQQIPAALCDFFESIDLIAVALDDEARVTFCNSALLAKTGWRYDEVLGANWIDTVIPAEQRASVRAEFTRIAESGEGPQKPQGQFENEILCRGGDRLLIAWTNHHMVTNGQFAGVFSVGQDITARRDMEAALKLSEARLKCSFQNAPVGIALMSLEGRTLLVNSALCQLLGYDEESLLDTSFLDLTHPDDKQNCLDIRNQLMARERETVQLEKRYMHREGHVVWALESVSLVSSDSSEPLHFIFQVQNIGEQKQTEFALRASEKFARSVVDGFSEQIAILGPEGTVLSVNKSWRENPEKSAPLSSGIAEGESYLECCERENSRHAAVAKEFAAGVRRVLQGELPEFTLEYAFQNNGEQQWFWGRATPFCDEGDGTEKSGRVVITHENITDSKRAEEDLRESNAILQATQEASAEGILLVDDRGVGVSYNQRFVELWNIDPGKVEEMRKNQELLAFVLDSLKDPDEFIQRINFLYDNPHVSAHDEIYLKDGRVFDRYSAPAVSPQGHSYGRVWSFSDITVRKTNEERLAHQAFHDVLTELPNRALFLDRLGRAISRAKRHHHYPAVLFLDLDRFKLINDSLGHEAGDQLLIAVAARLRECLRPEDTAARLGGDEFTILLEYITGVDDAIRVAERIAEELRSPFVIGKHEVFTTSSVGIALNTDESEQAEDLMRNADAAMYLAKSRGKAHYEVFDPNITVRTLEHLELENDLRRALKRGEFYLVYQPIVELNTGKILGAESLVRWQHPRRGVVLPQEFIPLAEETSLILQLGQWVMRQACLQACAWSEQQPETAHLYFSINLSARQFGQSQLIEDVADILKETGIDPQRIVLEVTESIIMEDAESTIGTLLALKKLGVQIAIDDFGTGYSSLSYLKRFPVDTLKVDRSFVSGLGTDSEDTAIVRAVITMAKTLGISVVAEGIETPAHKQQLRDLQCQVGQGYYFSRPLTATQFYGLATEKRDLP